MTTIHIVFKARQRVGLDMVTLWVLPVGYVT